MINGTPTQRCASGRLWLLLLLLGGTLAAICHEGFRPCEVFWANDAALGAVATSSARLPGIFSGYWGNFWWLGGAGPTASPSLSTLLATLLSPAAYLKIYAPLTQLFLGFSVWFFFRQMRFASMACVLAGLAAGLNMHFFSNACWGLGMWTVSTAMVFIALGVLVSPYIRHLWMRAVLTGLSVGMVVMEGFDVGAIYSVFIGLFILFYFWATEERKMAGAIRGLVFEAAVVVCAVLISASTLYTLVGTQIKGTTNGGISDADKRFRWGFTTQWSLPKLETARLFIPGLFGYRMAEFMTSTNKESAYWGRVAEDPNIQLLESGDPNVRRDAAKALGLPPFIQDKMASTQAADAPIQANIVDQVRPQVQRRHSGNGEYAGVLVCLLACFAIACAARRGKSPFTPVERRVIWFWTEAAIFSLLAAWGRFGFVYQFVYHLPFLSDIRNPIKFLHPLNVGLIVLSGFALEALHRNYLPAPDKPKSFIKHFSAAWKGRWGFEKTWAAGCLAVFVTFLAGYFYLNSSQDELSQYLEHIAGFSADVAPRMAAFCVGEAGLFLLFCAVSASVIIIISTGALAGKRAGWAWGLLAAILIVDLARSDVPWVRYFNYQQKYTPNAVLDFLQQKPWEYRVASRFSPIPGSFYDLVPGANTGTPDNNVGALCHWWLENDYPYHDIQCLEMDQAPRMPVLDSSYIGAFKARGPGDLSPAALQWAQTNDPAHSPLGGWVIGCGPAARLWRLTNTRYLFGSADFVDIANRFVTPANSFRTVMRLTMDYKPGITIPEDAGDLTVNPNPRGPLALIEFTAALPRAKLYTAWQVTGDEETLRALNSPQFDPSKVVLLATNTPVGEPSGPPDADPGTVEITRYRSRDILLDATARTASVLLLNERIGDFWAVRVDHQSSPLLRCNYIMRGVFLKPGHHTVEFCYRPPLGYLYISAAALLGGLTLAGCVMAGRWRGKYGDTPPVSGRPNS